MTGFIEINEVECGRRMLINVNKIVCIYPKEDRGACIRCENSFISTAESYDEICEMIRQAGKEEAIKRIDRLLIELPCAVGDTVYLFSHDIIHPFIINGFEINKYEVEFKGSYCGEEKNLEHWTIRLPVSKIYKTVFLTKEEAEAKLKEAGEQNG